MQRDKDVPFLVSSSVCVCARILCIACSENGFVDVITRVHGHIMFAKCLAMRPDSLLLHGPVFRSRCHCFAGIWNRAATVWAVRLEMDWQHYDHWRDLAQRDSRIRFRPVSAKSTRRIMKDENPSRHRLPWLIFSFARRGNAG